MRHMLIALILVFSSAGRADTTKEFLMSCTYGVLAGTLVGMATLAFTDKPGENLQAIARGASLGLYAGILLGVHVVYVVPGQIEEYDEEGLEGELPPVSRLQIYPTLGQNLQLDGIQVGYRLLDF